jgi:hypothetical protein
MQRWTSDPLYVPRDPAAPWKRAALAFENVEHDGPSFRVLLYVNNPNANETTDRNVEQGYAAEFPIFAHGDCWGDAGHCDADLGPVSAFDRRPLHPLTPISVSVDITEALRGLEGQEKVTVTALAFSAQEQKADILRFTRLHLLTYD